jgi:hypothetical protein
MILRIAKLWTDSTPVEFESSFGLSESIERLRAATRRSVFLALARQEAVGTVTETRASLQRAIPMVGNTFKPFYPGRFIDRNGKVILIGRFGMHWFAKAFMAFWFGGIGIFALFSVFLTNNLQQAALLILAGLGMMAFGTALVSIGKWFARNDAKWLSDVIRGALSAQVLAQPTQAGAFASGGHSAARRPLVLTIVASVLALGGVGSLLGLGGQPVPTASHGLDVTYFSDAPSRYVTVCLGIVLLALAFGVYRRRLLAWRAGLGLLAGSLVYSLAYSVASMLSTRADPVMTVIFCGVSLFVTAIWGLWWHAQRIHFQD